MTNLRLMLIHFMATCMLNSDLMHNHWATGTYQGFISSCFLKGILVCLVIAYTVLSGPLKKT